MSHSSAVTSLLERLRQRKLAQWLVGYLAGAWLLLQVLGFLAQTFDWPPLTMRVLTVLLAGGVLIVLILGWYHGERGEQRLSKVELSLLSLALTLTLGAAALVARARPESAEAAPLGEAAGSASIAVLPFKNLSNNSENEYFSDGITEELLNALAEIPGLRVVARTSSFALKGKELSSQDVARKLGVAHILEGSVQRSGLRVRINAKLIDARTARLLWSSRFDRELKDIFAVEDEISRAIADALRVRLTRAPTALPRNTAAHELYLRGRFHWNRSTHEGIRKSIEYYGQAIALDSSYADAYAGLAEAYLWLTPWERYTDLLPHIRTAVEKALALDPRNAQAYAVQSALSHWFDWDVAASERAVRRAIELNPNAGNVRDYYSWILLAQGKQDEAIRVMQEAVQLDPLSATLSYALEFRYVLTRQYDAAIRQHERTRELDPNQYFWDLPVGIAYREKGDYARAVEAYESMKRRLGNRPLHGLAITYARMGRTREARQELQQLLALRDTAFVPPEHIALVYANLGETRQALRSLEKAIQERSGWQLIWPDYDPGYDPLRSHPEFQAMRRRVKQLSDSAGR